MKSTKERDEQAFFLCAPVRACRQAAASSASACTGRARDAHGQTQALGRPQQTDLHVRMHPAHPKP